MCVCVHGCRCGSGESQAELVFSGSQEKDEAERMFPKVSVKATGASNPT